MENLISGQAVPQAQDNHWMAEHFQALGQGQGLVLRPPYQGRYRRTFFNPQQNSSGRIFGSADRQYTQNGQIVAQLWTEQSVPSFGLIESGLRRNFTADTSGQHRIVVQVDAGPITRIRGASTFVRALIPGLGGAYGNASSNQTSYLAFTANLQKDIRYQVLVIGGVVIANQPGPPSYGEVIATFPKIDVYPSIAGLAAVGEDFDSRLGQAMADASPVDAANALSQELEEGHTVEMD